MLRAALRLVLGVVVARAIAMKRMVAFDLDGTLLNPQHALSAATLAKVRELHALGVRVAFATGRSAPAVYEHVAALGLTGTLPCVLYNGAVCLSFPQPCATAAEAAAKKETLFEASIPLDDAKAVCAFAEKRGILVQRAAARLFWRWAAAANATRRERARRYYCGDHIYVKTKTDAHRDFVRRYQELTGATHTTVNEYPFDLTPAKMLLMTDSPDDVLAEVRQAQADGEVPAGLSTIRGSPPFFVEILRGDVCKGSGLSKLCDHLGISLADDVVAFGDGENDLEFVRDASLGVAMANGRDAVKAVADRVTAKTNAEDGVAHEIAFLQAEGILPS